MFVNGTLETCEALEIPEISEIAESHTHHDDLTIDGLTLAPTHAPIRDLLEGHHHLKYPRQGLLQENA
jgi:hypothetical protein